jgi:hypothetical protein
MLIGRDRASHASQRESGGQNDNEGAARLHGASLPDSFGGALEPPRSCLVAGCGKPCKLRRGHTRRCFFASGIFATGNCCASLRFRSLLIGLMCVRVRSVACSVWSLLYGHGGTSSP